MADRPRLYRGLRISWSAGCGVVCVLLVCLWVRSYHTADRLHGKIWFPQSFIVASKEGRIAAIPFRWHGAKWGWQVFSYPVDDELSFPVGGVQQYESRLGFGWIQCPFYFVMRSTQTVPDGSKIDVAGAATATLNGSGPFVPYWFLVLVTAAIAIVPWLPWRFSLRTLLIAVTLVAMGLWLIVYFVRR